MTDIDNLQTSMVALIQKLTDKIEVSDQRSIKFQDELQVSVKSLFTEETAVQRAAINEHLQVQGSRVTNLEANLANLLVSVKAIKREKELRAAAAADFQAAKGEYESICCANIYLRGLINNEPRNKCRLLAQDISS